MRIALAELKLDELHVVYPGEQRYLLAKKVDVVPLGEFVGARRSQGKPALRTLPTSSHQGFFA